MGRVLNEAGFAFVMPDLRGNGQSEGKRGHIDSFAQYTDDLQAALDYTRGQSPKAQQDVMHRGSQLKLPLLILHGGADKINAVSGSEAFYSVAGSKE